MAKKPTTTITAQAQRDQQSLLDSHQVAWWYWRKHYLEAKRLQLAERMQDSPGAPELDPGRTG